jgi:cell division septum initiation protein DivIVA
VEDLDSPSGPAADDVIPALTRRVAYLEGRLVSTQGDLDAARKRIASYAEADRSLDRARADAYRSADDIRRRAQAEADEILKAAVAERETLRNGLRHLRGEREAPQTEPASPPSALDRETAVIHEMRTLLLEIVREVQAELRA